MTFRSRMPIALRAAALCAAVIGGAGCATTIGAAAAPADAATGTDKPLGTPVDYGMDASFVIEPAPRAPALVLPETTLTEIDLALVKKLRAAIDADTDATLKGEARAAIWDALATHIGGEAAPNPFIELASKRASDWRNIAAAEQKREQALAELKQAFVTDKQDLASRIGSERDAARRAALRASFDAAYLPYQDAIVAMNLAEPEKTETPRVVVPVPEPKTAVLDPLGVPAVRAQTAIVKGDFGAHAQSYSVDTSDDLISVGGAGPKPTFDLSGFYAGGQAVVNVAQVSDLAIGLLAFGRYHVTTSLPDSQFVSGSNASATVASEDAAATGAFAVGAGARLAGNVFERVGMNFGVALGYTQFLAPAEVPGCGPDQVAWDPALRGVQGDIFVGGEFYPVAMLSLGISGRIGFGHVSGQWCVPADSIDPGSSTVVDTPLDVSADSFSVGAQGEIGVHF